MDSTPNSQLPAADSAWQRLAPIFTLVVLAPGIAEVLSGGTRVSAIFVLVPEMMVWGCGALLIREVVRRWGGGWTSMLLLGLALSIAEEFIIQQTSLAPLPFTGANSTYGRVWGVNLVYLLYMLGYESVWVVLVPVRVTELIYLDRRTQPWLKTTGIIVSAVVFVLGSRISWFLWIRIARPKVFHVPNYQPPLITILCGVTMIVLCALAAYAARNLGRSRPSTLFTFACSPWIVCLISLILGFPWYLLMTLIFGPMRNIAVWIPILLGLAWALLAFIVTNWMALSPGWGDTHRWALVFGATLVCMIAGFAGSGSWPRVDIVGKAVLNVIAVGAFFLLARKLTHRTPSTEDLPRD